MKKLVVLSAIVMFLGFTADTFAQRRSDRQRIRDGVRSGQITRDEAREIRERERQIRAERRVYRSDGVITRDERREIRRDEREQDRYIRSQRRDSERRHPSYNAGRHDRRRGYGHRGYGGYGNNGGYGGYNNANQIELDRGYQQGLETGASDGQRGQSYNPQRSRHYKNASTQAFREGFVRGYDQGYRQYSGYNNGDYQRDSSSGGLGGILGAILGQP